MLAKGIVGEYYGIQGTTWRQPPILDDPHETIVRDGRKLMVYRDGKRVRLVAWRTRKAVYWVANTLTQSLSGQQMIGIAGSLKRLERLAEPLHGATYVICISSPEAKKFAVVVQRTRTRTSPAGLT